MTPTEEVQECRHKLRLGRAAFGRRLGLSPTAAYPQVRKWEQGIGEPSAAALTAMRLLVELEEARRLPWMTPQLWDAAQIALEGVRAMAERHEYRKDYPTFHAALQVLRAVAAQEPKSVSVG
jgi:transcriptional regulator with XRE-family HTH domain